MDWINQLIAGLTAGQQFALFSLMKILAAIFLVLLPIVAYTVLVERKV